MTDNKQDLEIKRALAAYKRAEYTVPEGEGVKHDGGKPRMDLIPPEAMFALANILTLGAEKYDARNWEKGMDWGRVYAACMRHLWAWWGGRNPTSKSFLFGDLDLETGHSHLWHALACIVFLVTYEERKVGSDTRSSTSTLMERLNGNSSKEG